MPYLRVDDNIILKILDYEDSEELFRLVDDNRMYLREWLPWVDSNTSVENSRFFIGTTKDQHSQNLGFQCGIIFRDKMAGIIGFHRIDWMNKSVEIGYWLGKEFQGHGIITKSCRSLVDYAFYVLKLNRVQIRCATKNKRSCSVIERIGFILEGTTHQAEFLYDHYADLHVYGMTADKWTPSNKADTKYLRWVENI